MSSFTDWCIDHEFFGPIALMWAIMISVGVFIVAPIALAMWLFGEHSPTMTLRKDEWRCAGTYRQNVDTRILRGRLLNMGDDP